MHSLLGNWISYRVEITFEICNDGGLNRKIRKKKVQTYLGTK